MARGRRPPAVQPRHRGAGDVARRPHPCGKRLDQRRNNLPNRFEEAYGDAKNLRGRHPLAAMGFLFVLRSTVMDETGTLERVIDMLRKLRAEEDVYDATCLVLAEWDDGAAAGGVRVRNDVVPPDLRAAGFLGSLVDAVLDRTPVDMHVAVRERRARRPLSVEETNEGADL